MRQTLCILSLISLLLCGISMGVATIQFNQNCSGYLKRAADANTIEMAEAELGKAVAYIEAQRLTYGYTSVVYQTPDEDIGFWHNNLKASLEELQKLPATVTPLERSNMLIKLRETLLDHGQHGEAVTMPAGISRYPYNRPYAFWFWASLIMASASGLAWHSRRYGY